MSHQDFYELGPNDLYKIISLGTTGAKPPVDLLEEEDEEPSLDVDTLKNVPKNLEPVANALYGAVEGTTNDSEAPPLALPLGRQKSNSDQPL